MIETHFKEKNYSQQIMLQLMRVSEAKIQFSEPL